MNTQSNVNMAGNQQSFNASTEADRLGFIMRDAQTTKSVAQPHVIPKLGTSYQKYLGLEATPMVGLTDDEIRHTPLWDTESLEMRTVPGIMTFEFDHLMAVRDEIDQPEVNDIFINKWEEMRLLNNATKNWQPQDLQIMWMGLMEIRAHVANLRRILNLMYTCTNHALNNYFNGETLVAALGFPMTETDMRQKVVGWANDFNVNVVGRLNNVRWLTGMVPGERRWAGMYQEIYKDVSVYTDYTQLYILKPKCVNFLHSAWDDSIKAYVWTFNRFNYGFDPDSAEPQAGGVVLFERYLQLVKDMITSIFYDDSAMDIIAGINAITERTKSGSEGFSSFLEFARIPEGGERVPLTYDYSMLLAIHNMTILSDAEVEAPQQSIESGTVSQRVKLPNNALMSANFAKVVNLPNFGATPSDMIVATQWTVVSPAVSIDPEDDAVYLRANSAGSEICTRAYIWADVWNLSTRQYVGFKAKRFDNVIKNVSTQGQGGQERADLILGIFADTLNFAYAPLMYFIDFSRPAAGNIDHPVVKQVLGQTEVLYSVGYRELLDVHRQFLRNFWGYPVVGTTADTVQTSWSDAIPTQKYETGSGASTTSSASSPSSAVSGGKNVKNASGKNDK